MAAELSFAFPLPLGLHARPASRLQELAGSFRSSIIWTNLRTGAAADAKSVLSLLSTDTLGDDPCRLRAEGPDEAGAIASLFRMIESDLPRLELQAESEQAASAARVGADAPRILELERAVVFSGIPAGPGVALGPAYVHGPAIEPELSETGPPRPPAEEAAAFRDALAAIGRELRARSEAAAGPAEQLILAAHLSMLNDPAFGARVAEEIERGGSSAAAAVGRAGRHFAAALGAARSAYLRERIADIRDVTRRIVDVLQGRPAARGAIRLDAPAVLFAEDLAPSEFLALDPARLLGLVLENTGPTSHTLILARARGIPAVTGVPGVRDKVRTGETVVLDGGRGLVVPAPSPAISRYFLRERTAFAEKEIRELAAASEPGRTSDGRRIEIAANIGHPEEAGAAWAKGAEGIGLFRTEFLLFDRTEPPGEDEQLEIYARLAREANGRPVIVRTFDVGGDKPIPFLPFPGEANPFLGVRGLRVYEKFPAIIRTQLRAILRAAVHGPLKIMFPMITAVDEAVRAREWLDEARAGLAEEGLPHRPDVEAGMMVEVPSAALLLDRFAAHVDFFSVGTNDLAQYVFAADRGNPHVRGLSQPLEPAFLRLLRQAVAAARERGKWIGLCGELAGSAQALPILAGLGFDELSMAAGAVPGIKRRLRTLDGDGCRRLVEDALGMSRAADVEALLRSFAGGRAGELIVPGLVRIGSDSRSRAEVLQELALMMEAPGRTDDRAGLERALWQREDTFSTGIGFGVAIPHCRTDAAAGASVAVLRLAAPIAWGAADEEPVDLAVMLALPAGEPARHHLELLARLSRHLVHDDFREALRAAPDADSIIGLLRPVLAGKQAGEERN